MSNATAAPMADGLAAKANVACASMKRRINQAQANRSTPGRGLVTHWRRRSLWGPAAPAANGCRRTGRPAGRHVPSSRAASPARRARARQRSRCCAGARTAPAVAERSCRQGVPLVDVSGPRPSARRRAVVCRREPGCGRNSSTMSASLVVSTASAWKTVAWPPSPSTSRPSQVKSSTARTSSAAHRPRSSPARRPGAGDVARL